MNLATIHTKTIEQLQANKPKVQQRRDAIAKLRPAKLPNLPSLHRRGRAWFSTTQSNATKGKGDVQVQLAGKNVGVLTLDPVKEHYLFYPTKKAKIEAGSKLPWQWSKSQKDAGLIREYLEQFADEKENEREIQWQLASALLEKSRKGKPEDLRNLCPVTMGGYPLEIGVSITSPGDVKRKSTGTMDLLVRQPRGPSGGRLLVFEVKKQDNATWTRKKIEEALTQAIRYATALGHEANDGGDTNRANYRRAFGLSEKGKGPLVFGVVIVMRDSGEEFRNTAQEVLKAFVQERGESRIERVGMLLYDCEKGQTKNWKWLPGWDAKEPLGASGK